MKYLVLSLSLVVIIVTVNAWVEYDPQPQQVHLSLGSKASEMMVTWVTTNATPESIVEFGSESNYFALDNRQEGSMSTFVDGGSEKRTMHIHRVLLTGLTPGAEYLYHVGSEFGWSEIFWFRAIRDGKDWSPRFAVYGDLGNVNGRSIPRLQQEVQRNHFDAILHVGDMAYDLNTDNARVGDEFMRQIQPIAAYLPYQTVVGNHEQAYNFSNYVARFSMINMRDGLMNNHFYSFDVGPVHFISFSTEFYFFVNYGWTQIAVQYDWLKKDLEEATKPENRAKRPWIIAMGHRPMYCSAEDDDCRLSESIPRKGIPILHLYGLEDLFYAYGVDIEIFGHEHNYERLFPVYDNKIFNGSADDPYFNPDAPVHIITGSAGNHERIDPFIKEPKYWSAFRIADYGYTRMQVVNETHINFEQVSDDKDGTVVDKFTVRKDKHGPYSRSHLIMKTLI